MSKENQDSLLDLLGMNEKGAEQEEKSEACCAEEKSGEDASAAGGETPAAKPAKKEVEFDDTWVVLYAGKTRFVSELKLKKYTEAELKKALQKDFPEFGVVKVVFNYNEKKKAVVPVVRGDVKGVI